MTPLLLAILASVAVAQDTCTPTVDSPTVMRNGDDFASIQLMESDTIDDCISLCCHTSNCAAFSFNQPQPERTCVVAGTCCEVGSTCCMLKNAVPPPTNNTYGPAVQTGCVTYPVLPAPTPPFSNSPLITGVSFGPVAYWEQPTGNATGDTWPSVWAADGTVYAWACDYKHATPFTPMAMFRIEGDPYSNASDTPLSVPVPPGGGSSTQGSAGGAHMQGNPGTLSPQVVAWDPIDYAALCAQYGNTGSYPNINTKPGGMLALPIGPSGTTLYTGVSCINYGTDLSFTRQTNIGGFVVSSTDSGVTWANVTAVGAFPGRFGAPVFVSCGRAFDACQQVDNGTVYVFFPGSFDDTSYWDNNDAMYLARTTQDHVAAVSQYQYFSGLNGLGQPTWNSDARTAQPVLTYGSMIGENAVSYNPYLQRYVMANFGLIDTYGRPRPWHSKPFMSPHRTQLLFLEAPRPWGPWSVFYRADDSPQAPGLYTPTFPSAYMRPVVPGVGSNPSTAQMVLFFSCLDGAPSCRYTLNYQIVTVVLNGTALALAHRQ